jgi:hypothetical protein
MAFTADYEVLFERLDEELQTAPAPTRNLFAKIIGSACSRIPVLDKAGKTERIDRLIAAEAWIECAAVLTETELPGWRLRRLVYDSGEWLCTLSRQPNVPVEFDDTVDATHEVPALAILRAFVEARRRTDAAEPMRSAIPRIWPDRSNAICCDNFA